MSRNFCKPCRRSFKTASGLGAHRALMHGIRGKSYHSKWRRNGRNGRPDLISKIDAKIGRLFRELTEARTLRASMFNLAKEK